MSPASCLWEAPPAASTASTTREPTGSTTMPGLGTLPSTSTVTVPADAPPDGTAAVLPGATEAVGSATSGEAEGEARAAGTTSGSARIIHQQATANPATSTSETTTRCHGPRLTRPRSGSGSTASGEITT